MENPTPVFKNESRLHSETLRPDRSGSEFQCVTSMRSLKDLMLVCGNFMAHTQ